MMRKYLINNQMNINTIAKNLLPKKLKSYKLQAISCKLKSFRNLPPTTYHLQPSAKGFTLVEMLVSISVFLVVMLVAASSLLSIIDGNNKAQSLKSAINNLNFALEDMEKNIRVGTDYSVNGCSSANACIGFTSYKDSASDGNDFIVYRLNNKSIERCIKPTATTISNCLSGDYVRMTAPEVQIDHLGFYPSSPSGIEKKRVFIVIGGSTGSKEKIKTEFNLQTTVSQRGF
jgi:prepilin-type N-terminal cleavage/methylation domain-containing protein